MKSLLKIFLIYILISNTAISQNKIGTIEDALSLTYALMGNNGPQSINWLPDGKGFSYIDEKSNIIIYDTDKKGMSNLFKPKEYTFNDNTEFKFDSFEWSKDFKYLVFKCNSKPVWRNSSTADYYLFSIENKSLNLVINQARTAQLSPNGKFLAYEKDGNLFSLDLNTKKTFDITNSGNKLIQNGRFGWVYEEEFGLVQAWEWSPDSQQIAFWETDESKVPIYRLSALQDLHPKYNEIPYPRVGDSNVNVRVGIANIVENPSIKWAKIDLNDGYIPRIYWTSQKGKLALQYLNRAQNELKLFIFDYFKNSTDLILQENDSKGWVDIFDFFANTNDFMKFEPKGDFFYWISGRTGFQHIYKYDLSGKLIKQLTNGRFDVVSIEAISDKNIYYLSNEVSPLEKKLYKIDKQGILKLLVTKEKGNHHTQVSEDGSLILDEYSNIDVPKQIQLLNSEGEKIANFEDNGDVISITKQINYTKKELQQFTNSNNQTIDISVLKPANFEENKEYPVLLSIYGGPGSQSVYNSWAYSGWEQWLSQNGYVVVSVNNRGSGGYGQDFMQSVYKNLGDNESQDFIEAIAFLQKKYKWVSKDKIAIQGHSYGGFMSAYSVLKHPNVFKAAIVGAPVTNWKLYDNIYTERYMGLLNSSENQYEKNNLALMAPNLKAKMILAHSLMDDNVHVLNSMQFVKALTDAQKDIDLRIYPEGNHGVAYSYESYVLLHKTYFNFLEKHLK